MCEEDDWIKRKDFTPWNSPFCRSRTKTMKVGCQIDGVEFDDFANDLLDLKAERQAIDEAERQTIDVD